MSDLTHTVRFRPAFDCIVIQPCVHGSETCKPGSGGSHGRHSVEVAFYLTGSAGAVQFVLYTGWMLDATPKNAWGHTLAADLGYHSSTPRYEDQLDYGPCELIGEHCYHGSSGLNAEEPWRILREQGDRALWSFLEGYYAEVFTERMAS